MAVKMLLFSRHETTVNLHFVPRKTDNIRNREEKKPDSQSDTFKLSSRPPWPLLLSASLSLSQSSARLRNLTSSERPEFPASDGYCFEIPRLFGLFFLSTSNLKNYSQFRCFFEGRIRKACSGHRRRATSLGTSSRDASRGTPRLGRLSNNMSAKKKRVAKLFVK